MSDEQTPVASVTTLPVQKHTILRRVGRAAAIVAVGTVVAGVIAFAVRGGAETDDVESTTDTDLTDPQE